MRRSRGLKPLDILIFILGAAAVAGVSFAVLGSRSGPPRVTIGGPGGEWVYPLDAEVELEVKGPLGSTWVHLHDGKIAIEKSPCPNQTCVTSAPISGVNQWLACLPNQVFVRIDGSGSSGAPGGLGSEEGVDAVVN